MAAPPGTTAPVSFLKSLVTPDPSMNYSVIAGVYALLTLLSLLFLLLEKYAAADSVRGFWLVPAPCLPCLAYILFLRSRVKASPAVDTLKDKTQ